MMCLRLADFTLSTHDTMNDRKGALWQRGAGGSMDKGAFATKGLSNLYFVSMPELCD
jgi:hypothetical protein